MSEPIKVRGGAMTPGSEFWTFCGLEIRGPLKALSAVRLHPEARLFILGEGGCIYDPMNCYLSREDAASSMRTHLQWNLRYHAEETERNRDALEKLDAAK